MSVLEQQEKKEITKDPDRMHHISIDMMVALCGYKRNPDADLGCTGTEWHPGENFCKTCGAEVCSICLCIAYTE